MTAKKDEPTIGDYVKTWLAPTALLATLIGTSFLINYRVDENETHINENRTKVNKLELQQVEMRSDLKHLVRLVTKIDGKLDK